MAEKDAGDFHLIITQVDTSRLADASKKFAGAFSLDETIATQIAKSAPIIFASNLTKKEVKAITPSLQNLSSEGMEFRITARVAKKIPKVNWPVRPQFTAGGIQGTNGLAFNWDNNAFICPGCGETFLFRRVGRVPFVEGAASVSAPRTAASAPAPAPAPQPQPVAAAASPAVRKIDDGDVDLAPMEAEQVELSEEVEDIQLGDDDLNLPSDDADDLKLEDDVDLAAEPVLAEEPLLDDAGGLENVEEVGEISGGLEEEIADEPAPPPTGDLYNVFLSKISDKKKQKKAADLIASVKGCSAQEAKELASRLVIPLAKNVSKEQAEGILAQFKKLKIFGRMTKAK